VQCSTHGENTVAEHVFGLILNLSRKIYKAYQVTSKGKFSYEGLMGFDLKGKTLGVLGTGKIGQNVIKIANGFEMSIIAYDPYPREELQLKLGFKYVVMIRSKLRICFSKYPLNSRPSYYYETASKTVDWRQSDKYCQGTMALQMPVSSIKQWKAGGAGLDVLEARAYEGGNAVISTSAPSRDQWLHFSGLCLMRLYVIVIPHLHFQQGSSHKNF
jgi:D-lactate dehydrogenase